MPRRKNTTIINEIEDFFKKSNQCAIQRVIELLKAIKMTDRKLGLPTDRNARRKTSEKLLLLVLFSFFNIKNPNQFASSALFRLASAGKDQFYRLLNSHEICWRNVGYKIFNALRKAIVACGSGDAPVCLIVDDTDLRKRGYHMEKIGKIHSHTDHTFKLGYKKMSLCLDDGKQLLNVDFSLHCEKGKKCNYGLTKKQLAGRKKVKHLSKDPDYERFKECDEDKPSVLLRMLRRFARHGHKTDYLLADSWFASAGLIAKVAALGCVTHYLGMAKFGGTKYTVNGREVSAKRIASSKVKRTRCRKLNYTYIDVKADYKGTPVRLFVCRAAKADGWRVIITTDLTLGFEQAYRIYARRWNIEVFYKECKQHLRLGKCQSHTLDAQIAATTVCMIQYNLLATAKRFESYETFGEMFRAVQGDVSEATLTNRMWLIICTLLNEVAIYFQLDENILIEKYLCDTEHFTNLINLKSL